MDAPVTVTEPKFEVVAKSHYEPFETLFQAYQYFNQLKEKAGLWDLTTGHPQLIEGK